LAANIATAPSMSWAPILVAGWPLVALLLAVELLGHRRQRDSQHAEREPERGNDARTETPAESKSENLSRSETGAAVEKVITLAESRLSRHTAEEVMWEHYRRTVSAGLPAPTGAELDEVTHTNNYGRAVLRKWRRRGEPGRRPCRWCTDGRRSSLGGCSYTDVLCWGYEKSTTDPSTAQPASQGRRRCQLGEHQRPRRPHRTRAPGCVGAV
jgi:hypothetical protein